MVFSPKRAKAVAQGKVVYAIMDGNTTVFTHKNFFVTVQQLDMLQKASPEIKYIMTITEVK